MNGPRQQQDRRAVTGEEVQPGSSGRTLSVSKPLRRPFNRSRQESVFTRSASSIHRRRRDPSLSTSTVPPKRAAASGRHSTVGALINKACSSVCRQRHAMHRRSSTLGIRCASSTSGTRRSGDGWWSCRLLWPAHSRRPRTRPRSGRPSGPERSARPSRTRGLRWSRRSPRGA